MNRKRLLSIVLCIFAIMFVAGCGTSKAQSTSATASPQTTQVSCDTVTPPPGMKCQIVNGNIVSVPVQDQCTNVTPPPGWQCQVHEDGTVGYTSVTPSAANGNQSLEDTTATIVPMETATPSPTVAPATQTQTNTERVSLPTCPTVFEVQQRMGAMMQKAAGEPCAFNIRSMNQTQPVTTVPGWATELQVDGGMLIVFIGDGRTYDALAVTTRPTLSNPCDQWAGSYNKELSDDASGVGYDAYVVLPANVTTCTANTPNGLVDALSLGRVVNADELNKYVSQSQSGASAPVTSTTVETPVSTEASPTQTPVSTEAAVVTTSTPTNATETATQCPPTAEDAAKIFGGVATDYAPVGTNGWQYSGAAVDFTVPAGMVVDTPAGRSQAGAKLTGETIFTVYWLSCP